MLSDLSIVDCFQLRLLERCSIPLSLPARAICARFAWCDGTLAGIKPATNRGLDQMKNVTNRTHLGRGRLLAASFKDRELIVDTARYLEAGERFAT